MAKAELGGVEQVAEIARQRGRIRLRNPADRIQRIADERMTGRGEMDANLMRPAAVDRHVADERVASLLANDDVTRRRLAVGARRVHRTETIVRHRANRRVDAELVTRGPAAGQRSISFVHGSLGPLP